MCRQNSRRRAARSRRLAAPAPASAGWPRSARALGGADRGVHARQSSDRMRERRLLLVSSRKPIRQPQRVPEARKQIVNRGREASGYVGKKRCGVSASSRFVRSRCFVSESTCAAAPAPSASSRSRTSPRWSAASALVIMRSVARVGRSTRCEDARGCEAPFWQPVLRSAVQVAAAARKWRAPSPATPPAQAPAAAASATPPPAASRAASA